MPTRMGNPAYGDKIIENVIASMYGPSPVKQAELQQKADSQRLARDFTAAKIASLQAKDAALAAAGAAKENAPRQMIESQGIPDIDAALAYFRGDMVKPQSETADLPGIVGGYPVEPPAGLTPDFERRFRRDKYDSAVATGLPGKGSNFAQFRQGQGYGQDQGIIAQALAGLLTPQQQSDVAGARSKPTNRLSAQGIGENLFTGEIDETGGLAQASIANTKAQAGERGARGALYGARAAESGANRALLEAKTDTERLRDPTAPRPTAPKPAKPPPPVSEKSWDETIDSILGIAKGKTGKSLEGSAVDLDIESRNRLKKEARAIRDSGAVIDLGEAVQLAIERGGGLKKGTTGTGKSTFWFGLGKEKERKSQSYQVVRDGKPDPMPPPSMGAAPAPVSEPTATGPGGKKIVFRNGQWVPLN